jgi:hypothetical protein
MVRAASGTVPPAEAMRPQDSRESWGFFGWANEAAGAGALRG